MKGTTGGSEMLQVEGGHILRSTCRKDRHSKVYTSKGPRDRRVRLSAHTAIQFYDVQDRLGYDRPSKAVDWLLNKAKTAIDNLHHSEDHSLIQPNGFTSSFIAPDQPGANLIKPFFPTQNFPGFSDDDSASFQAEDLLGLSLHSFQGNLTNFPGSSFHRINEGWNNGTGDMDARVGFLTSLPENSAMFSHRELLQSNSPLNPWNQRQFGSTNLQNPHPDFDSPFELGFRVPARIYGDEEGDDE